MSYVSLTERISIVSKLIELAKADGVVSPTEVTYIFWMAKKLEVSQVELTRLFAEAAPHSAPITEKDRVLQFQKCLNIIVLDSEVAEEELNKCLEIAKDLRLPEDKTLQVLETLKSDPSVIEEEKLLAIYL